MDWCLSVLVQPVIFSVMFMCTVGSESHMLRQHECGGVVVLRLPPLFNDVQYLRSAHSLRQWLTPCARAVHSGWK